MEGEGGVSPARLKYVLISSDCGPLVGTDTSSSDDDDDDKVG